MVPRLLQIVSIFYTYSDVVLLWFWYFSRRSVSVGFVENNLGFGFGFLTLESGQWQWTGVLCILGAGYWHWKQDAVCMSVLYLSVTVINTVLYTQPTIFDEVFLLAAFHCIATICKYCFMLCSIKYLCIYLSICAVGTEPSRWFRNFVPMEPSTFDGSSICLLYTSDAADE